MASRLVHLVDEGQDRDATLAADGEEFLGLRLDTFGAVQHHDGAVHGHECAICVFAEVLVAWRVEQVDPRALIVELQHGGGNRNAARLLQFHPVGLGLTLAGARLHRAGQVHRAGIEQQLFGQGGFSGVRMGNDRKRAPSQHFAPQFIGRGFLNRQGHSSSLCG